MAHHASRTESARGQTLEPEALLLDTVAQHRRRVALRFLGHRLLLGAAVALLALLLAVAADHIWPGGLPRPARAVGLAAWGALLVMVCGLGVVLALARRVNLLYVAQEIEHLRGIRHNALINALLLRGSRPMAYARRAALTQAAREVLSHSDVERPAARGGRLPLGVVVVTLVAWAGYLLLSPKPVGTSVARFFGAETPPPSATRLELIQPRREDVVHAGEALELVFALHGRPVDSVRLHILEANAEQAAARQEYVARVERQIEGRRRVGRFTLAPFEVLGDIHYRALAGDARLRGSIDVRPQPDIESLEIVLQPPAYTGRLPQRAAQPDLEVLAGTLAAFRVVANTPIDDPVFVFRNQRESRTRMRVDPAAPRAAAVERFLSESGTYRIEFTDPWGYPYRDPSEHAIVVVEDAPPTARIVVPTTGQAPGDVVDVTRIAELVVVASDDLGVAELSMLVEPGAGEALRSRLHSDRPRPRVMGRVATSGVPLLPGQSVRVWFEARDGRQRLDGEPAPQVGRSRVLVLTRPVPAGPEEQAQREPGDQPREDGDPRGREGAGGEGQSGAEPGENAGRGDATQPGEAERRAPGAGAPEQSGQELSPDENQGEAGGQRAPGQPARQPGERGGGQHESGATRDDQQRSGRGERSQQAGAGESAQAGERPSTGPGRREATGDRDETPPGSEGEARVGSSSPEPEESLTGSLEDSGRVETPDLVDMIERGESISEEMLIEMGWSAERAAAFVERLERLRGVSRGEAESGAARRDVLDTSVGTRDRQVGSGVGAGVRREATSEQSEADDIGRTAPPDDERVPAELRELLDAYYRSLAGRRSAPRG